MMQRLALAHEISHRGQTVSDKPPKTETGLRLGRDTILDDVVEDGPVSADLLHRESL